MNSILPVSYFEKNIMPQTASFKDWWGKEGRALIDSLMLSNSIGFKEVAALGFHAAQGETQLRAYLCSLQHKDDPKQAKFSFEQPVRA